MAGRINDEDVQALRERANLAAIVSDYTALKRSGSRLKGLCPFHGEKTPSFFVDPARGFFHCFGCDAGGDVYDFLQRVEALTFPEAVERLARIEGVTLRYEELSPGQRRALGRRTRLVECLGEANAFYRAQLRTEAGRPAAAYLARRGMTSDVIDTFELGWAPDAWDATVRHLTGKQFSPQEIADAGLATRGQRGLIDRFRGRVMFPIYDASGRDVVAFGGRVVPGVEARSLGQNSPKYINSPETEVYRKSRTLYGLNWARAEIQRRDAALVVEGYIDVIALHQAGVPHAVATCGTALTAEHFQQLEKFARRVILALDADTAGYRAADRARALAVEQGVREVGVLRLPPGQDPADLAAEGPDRVAEALAATPTAVEFQIEFLLQEADTSTPEGQVAAYRRTFPLLAQLNDRFLRYSYIRDIVAPAVRLSADLIEQELDADPDVRRATPSPPSNAPAPANEGLNLPRDPQLQLEREVLQAAVQHPEISVNGWDDVSVDDFTAEPSRMLYTALVAAPWTSLSQLLERLPDDRVRARIRALAVAPSPTGPDPHKLAEKVKRLRARTLSRRISQTRTQDRKSVV